MKGSGSERAHTSLANGPTTLIEPGPLVGDTSRSSEPILLTPCSLAADQRAADMFLDRVAVYMSATRIADIVSLSMLATHPDTSEAVRPSLPTVNRR